MSGRRAAWGVALVIVIVVFGEAIGELLVRWMLWVGLVLVVAGVLIAWWSSYVDDEPEVHEYESCAWGAIGQDNPNVCTPERRVRIGGRLVIERCRQCKLRELGE